jgi:hypothetical protein
MQSSLSGTGESALAAQSSSMYVQRHRPPLFKIAMTAPKRSSITNVARA